MRAGKVLQEANGTMNDRPSPWPVLSEYGYRRLFPLRSSTSTGKGTGRDVLTYLAGFCKGFRIVDALSTTDMSGKMTSSSRSVSSPVVSYQDSHRRWFVLRCLSSSPYPMSVSELADRVASHLDSSHEEVEAALVERDLPALTDCNAVKYDSYTDLVCLFDEHGTFEKYVRRAVNAGAILRLTPPKASSV